MRYDVVLFSESESALFKLQYPTLPMFLSKSDEQISQSIILQRKYKVKGELFTFGCKQRKNSVYQYSTL